jgi:hypothetical protein
MSNSSPLNLGKAQGRFIESTGAIFYPSINITDSVQSLSLWVCGISRSCIVCLVISNMRRSNKREHKIYFVLVFICYNYLLQMDRLLTFQCDFKNQSFSINFVYKRQVCYLYIVSQVTCSIN